MEIKDMLREREVRYGSFDVHAAIAQGIKREMEQSPNWRELSDPMREALEMTAHKIARILNGDPQYQDNWVDIAGYVQLVIDILEAQAQEFVPNVRAAA